MNHLPISCLTRSNEKVTTPKPRGGDVNFDKYIVKGATWGAVTMHWVLYGLAFGVGIHLANEIIGVCK